MLALLQDLLQRLYGLDIEESVEDFVITDRRFASALRGAPVVAPEELLVRQADDELAISLFLEPSLLAAVARGDPLRRLHGHHLNPLCTLLEGVSHFVYLVSRARQARPVTRLELELQAEVDKFAILTFLLRAQRQGTLPGWLPRRLFEKVRYHAHLDDEALSRYRTANACARRYCRRLQRRFQWGWNGRRMVQELRHFHALGQTQKLRHIDR